MSISAQVLVENEENFVWFSVMSVIDFVDEVILYDAGSVDMTSTILTEIKKRYPQKVIYKTVGKLSPQEYPKMRNEMLKSTKCDWILIVDGDEVWWQSSISELSVAIRNNGDQLDSIVTPFSVCIGDLYHLQNEKAGKYQIDNIKGNLTIHAINRHLSNLHVEREYGNEGYFVGNTLVQNLPPKKRLHFAKSSFLHLTHLERTKAHSLKVKRDIGHLVNSDFYYPEVFFKETPSFVPNPWRVPSLKNKALNVMLGKSREIKRTINRN